MGLIKAAISSVGGTFADQWKEFIYCDSIPNDVLAVRGRKKTSGRSSNTKGLPLTLQRNPVFSAEVSEKDC